MKIMRHRSSVFPLAPLLTLGLAACASAPHPPPELLAARTAYSMGQQGAAWQYDRAGLNSAASALNQAEMSFQKHGDTQATRDSATLALRRARQAERDGVATLREQSSQTNAKQSTAEAKTETQAALPAGAESGEASASGEPEAAGSGGAELAPSASSKVAQTESETIDQPRQKAVITLAVALFPVGQTKLAPEAHQKLDELADTLRTEPDATIHIRGHADSTGSDSRNLQLSHERAEQVADYLSSHGVPRDHMQIDSVGDTQPITREQTPQGKAIDRRVQLVIYVPAKQASQG